MEYLFSDEMIGHEIPRQFLTRSLKAARHHAYLFAGPEHLGKDAVARAFVAQALNRPVKSWDDLVSNPDVAVIARAADKKNIGIEELRGFINHFTSSPFWGGYKIGVILGAHEMSLEAANALLKTLEEPAAKSLIVLVAVDAGSLPETVRSRCQHVRFLPVPVAKIREGLARRGVTDAAAEEAAALSIGRPGLAIDLATQKDDRQKYVSKVHDILGLAAAEPAGRLRRVGELVADALPTELMALLDVWVAVFRDTLAVKMGNGRYAANQFAAPAIGRYAAGKSAAEIVRIIRSVFVAKRLLGENVNPRLIFENIALAL